MLGCLAMEEFPFRMYGGSNRIRDLVRERADQLRRADLLEEGLRATETALAGTQEGLKATEAALAACKEGLADTEANRLWLLGLVEKYEAEGWSDFLLRWLGRWRRRLKAGGR